MSLALSVHSNITRTGPLSFLLLSCQDVAGSGTEARSQRDLYTRLRKEAHLVVHEYVPGSRDSGNDDHCDESEQLENFASCPGCGSHGHVGLRDREWSMYDYP